LHPPPVPQKEGENKNEGRKIKKDEKEEKMKRVSISEIKAEFT